SRRIGRSPQGTATGDFVDAPTSTRILGAGKLTGKTRNGWTLGIVEAVTDHDNADVSTQGQRSKAEVEPMTNYMVGRVLCEYSRAGFGFLTTSVERDLRSKDLSDLLSKRSHLAGADAYWFLDSKKMWVVTGKLAGSFVNGSNTAIDNLQQSPQHYFPSPYAPEGRPRPGSTSMQ